MSLTRLAALLVASLLLVSLVAQPAPAQTETASQFYMRYRAAFDNAKKIEDLTPFLSKKSLDMINSTPAAERPKFFEMMKMMGSITDVKILKETKTADGAMLAVEAMDPDKKKTNGKVEVVKEGSDWKLGSENWSS
jgi:esterase/lipase